MDLVPEPENHSEKEVYAFFGLTAYAAQVVEKELVNMVVIFKVCGLRISRQQFDLIFDSHDSRTFGQLLQAARNHDIPIPEDLDHLLTLALKKRNYVNHDFFADHAGHFMSESGKQVMIKRLREIIHLFDEAKDRCELIYRPLVKRMGVSEEMLKKTRRELIEKAKEDSGGSRSA